MGSGPYFGDEHKSFLNAKCTVTPTDIHINFNVFEIFTAKYGRPRYNMLSTLWS